MIPLGERPGHLVLHPHPVVAVEAVAFDEGGVHLLTPEAAFRVTALADGGASYEAHLVSLLRHSPVRSLQWINFSRSQVQFVTLNR